MNPKELIKQFKNSPWRNEQDIASFLLAIDTPIDSRTVAQLLDVLLNKRLASDAGAHGVAELTELTELTGFVAAEGCCGTGGIGAQRRPGRDLGHGARIARRGICGSADRASRSGG